MGATIVVGGFFGDEGKGKLASYLTLNDDLAACVRAGVGPNAGHTIMHLGKTIKIRLVPSGFVNKETKLLIGPGVLIDSEVLLKEIKEVQAYDRLIIDQKCGIIEKEHIETDKKGNLKNKIATTGTGTGPANADRALRKIKLAKDANELSAFIGDVPYELGKLISSNQNILIEGTQGMYISLYHGEYPYVTSKDVTASAACSDVGIGPKNVDEVIVVFKSYVTRVGAGPLENEISEEEINKKGWSEFGTVTGRQTRAAPFNFELAKKACIINSATQIALTKLDILYPQTAGISDFSKLDNQSSQFIKKIEEETGVPVTLIGTGANENHIIDRRR